MSEFKLVINDGKSGKSYQKIITGSEADVFIGLKIGGKIHGDLFGLRGYELEVRGGSDLAGFPMRFDIDGSIRKKPYVSQGPGARRLKKGEKARKTVVGNIISTSIRQVNLKIVNYGQKPVEESLGIKPKEEIPKEEKKESKEHKKEVKEERIETKEVSQ